ncbi:MAG: cupin domain-containing protein [Gammaproteobacteria bacterium]|nr:cupin domain-containing protein [Gammaproteobacteria bacterium]
MLIKRTSECNEFTANDGCGIREVLHPRNDGIDMPLSLAIARVEPGKQSYAHYLKQVEVYYILEGRGLVHIGEETAGVGPAMQSTFPPGASQWIENTR